MICSLQSANVIHRECTCKIDKSLNRRMCIKFESRKICVACNQCDSSDFDFHNAEHKELPVIKISSDEGKKIVYK